MSVLATVALLAIGFIWLCLGLLAFALCVAAAAAEQDAAELMEVMRED